MCLLFMRHNDPSSSVNAASHCDSRTQCVSIGEPNDGRSPARKLRSVGPEEFIYPNPKERAPKQTKAAERSLPQ
ncbi:hypothetical protein KC338_g310 [Hortaea werneckii]|nr:hypothetical protein KC338_g310 [Hortaea werneckii]